MKMKIQIPFCGLGVTCIFHLLYFQRAKIQNFDGKTDEMV